MLNDVPVVFTFDKKIVRAAAVALQSMMDSAAPTTRYCMHVLHPGLSAAQQEAFARLCANTRHTLKFHRIDNLRFAGLPTNRGSWSEVVYYRFIIPEILSEYSRVIYSDVDVFFQGDLASLMEEDMDGCAIGAVVGEANHPAMQCHTYFPENTKAHIFMSGFLLMDLERMRFEGLTEKLLATAHRFGDRLRMFDLDALNLTCERILPLPFTYCVLESIYASDDMTRSAEFAWLQDCYPREDLEAARDNPVIIHYAGKLGKPWRRPDVPPYYKAYLEKVPPALNTPSFRDIRKYWVSRIFGRRRRPT